MNLQPILENDLILIRPLKVDDFKPLYKVAKDPLIWAQHHIKRYKPDIFKKFFEDSLKSGGALIFIDQLTNEIIGSSRFNPIDGFPEGMEIGWSFLARHYWGGKYNRSVKKLMMDHAFSYVDHVILNIHKNNIRSQKAAEKIGGKRLSISDWTLIPRKNDDTLIYLISN